jgi:hypothetical protein
LARLPQERFPLDFPEIGLFGLADHAARGCRSAVGLDIADLDLGVLGAGHAARETLARPFLIAPSWEHRSSQRTQIIRHVAEFPDHLGIAEIAAGVTDQQRKFCFRMELVIFIYINPGLLLAFRTGAGALS